ncbi:MAG: PAS domain-containing protein [Gammaproteobacteria bacterium]|nr:PAS domain-containing protein [Gammaproteobacteria bacterium]
MAIIKATAQGDLAWRVLSLLNLYRLLVPIVLVSLHFTAPETSSIGWLKSTLFLTTAALYFSVGILMIAALKVRWPDLSVQAWVHLCVDVLAISLLLYSSGGAGSGLGLLMAIPVGAISLLLPRRAAFVAAAGATLALLAQQLAVQLAGYASTADYTAAGVLGVVLFILALSGWPLANQLRESEELVRQRDVDLANLAELSQYIVQHLRESILVVDVSDRIRLINESAAQILGDRAAVPGALLGEVSAKLLYFLSTWRQNPHDPNLPPASFLAADGTRVVQPHFATLGGQNPGPVLVFLRIRACSPSACNKPSSRHWGA